MNEPTAMYTKYAIIAPHNRHASQLGYTLTPTSEYPVTLNRDEMSILLSVYSKLIESKVSKND